jgi:hypothetical protein
MPNFNAVGCIGKLFVRGWFQKFIPSYLGKSPTEVSQNLSAYGTPLPLVTL